MIPQNTNRHTYGWKYATFVDYGHKKYFELMRSYIIVSTNRQTLEESFSTTSSLSISHRLKQRLWIWVTVQDQKGWGHHVIKLRAHWELHLYLAPAEQFCKCRWIHFIISAGIYMSDRMINTNHVNRNLEWEASKNVLNLKPILVKYNPFTQNMLVIVAETTVHHFRCNPVFSTRTHVYGNYGIHDEWWIYFLISNSRTLWN